MADDRSASMLELKAIDAPHGHYDVAILGGGLAGLTIAIQLKRERPETRVLVTDKRTEPAPEAAFKVGESSVEIGAYYYREMIGMRDHLEKYQQRKLGPAVLHAGRRQLGHHQARRVLHARPPRRVHPPDRPRAVRERAVPARSQGRRRRVPRLARAGRRARRRTSTPILMSQEDEDVHRHRALDRRRERPREHPAAQARRWATASTPGTTATRRGSGSPAGSTSRTGPTTRSGSAGCPRRACGSTRPRT